MTFTLTWLILAFVAGAFSMLLVVVLYGALVASGRADDAMLPVHSDDDDDFDDDGIEDADGEALNETAILGWRR